MGFGIPTFQLFVRVDFLILLHHVHTLSAHQFLQGVPTSATSMHSVRLEPTTSA